MIMVKKREGETLGKQIGRVCVNILEVMIIITFLMLIVILFWQMYYDEKKMSDKEIIDYIISLIQIQTGTVFITWGSKVSANFVKNKFPQNKNKKE